MEANLKILVVDDDLDVIISIQYHLQNENYTTLKATNTDEALGIILREHPDLIICDTYGIGTEIRDSRVYPDGFEFYQMVKENPDLYGNPKIIGMSSIQGNLQMWQEEYKADGVLKKPEDISKVVDLVAKVLSQQ